MEVTMIARFSNPSVHIAVLLGLSFAGLGAPSVFAQTAEPAALTRTAAQPPLTNAQIREALKTKLNENAMTIISGNPNGGYLGIAYDIAAVVDDGDDLRVMPVVGNGAVQNLKDILFLRGIDMGIVNTVTLNYFKKTGELGTTLDAQIAYIAMLFQDELHVLARPEFKSFRALEGKRINFSDKGSGAQLSAQTIFAALGMKVTEFNMGQADAIEMMKRGELDATMCTCLKPLRPHQQIARELGFKLLSMDYEPAFFDDYLPAQITHEDYPNLIAEGEVVNTLAVSTLLAVYNWPPGHERYRRLEKFVGAFFAKFPEFAKPPRHPRWKTVNIGASLPKWKRFAPAQAWLDANYRPASLSADPKMKAAFEEFLAVSAKRTGVVEISDDKKRVLFDEFTKWWAVQSRAIKRP
jgi:TRAP-type uncharacterized transport system substrate-binding protein